MKTGETQTQVKVDEKRSEVKIVTYILRDARLVALAIDNGFNPDMPSRSSSSQERRVGEEWRARWWRDP